MTYDVSFFHDELFKIRNRALRDAVREELSHAPAWFWDAPSSSTGKYHPDYANGPGGLCRHIKFVCYLVAEFARCLEQLNVDILIAAALLHDLYKFGGGSEIENTDCSRKQYRAHGAIAADVLMGRLVKKYDKSYASEWKVMCEAIRMHMGRFEGHDVTSDPYAMALSIADITASRKEIVYGPMYVLTLGTTTLMENN